MLGAGAGIGEQTALQLAAEGCNLILVDMFLERLEGARNKVQERYKVS